MSSENWSELLFQALESAQNPEKAPAMEAYMKHNFRYLGLPAPSLTKLAGPHLKAGSQLPGVNWDFVEAAWQKPYREAKYCACSYLGRVSARLAAADFDVVITSLSAGPEVDPADRLSARAPTSQAWSGLVDAELERWFDAWHRAVTVDERLAAARAIERRVQLLAPLVYIAVDVRGGLARADVGGLVGDGRGVPPAWRLWRARP